MEPHDEKEQVSETRLVAVLKELDGGTPATTLERRHGVYPNTIRGWRDKYAGLELDNTQMRRLIARKEHDAVRELIEKNVRGFAAERRSDGASISRTLAEFGLRDHLYFDASYSIQKTPF